MEQWKWAEIGNFLSVFLKNCVSYVQNAAWINYCCYNRKIFKWCRVYISFAFWQITSYLHKFDNCIIQQKWKLKTPSCKCSNKYKNYSLMLVIWEISERYLLQNFGYHCIIQQKWKLNIALCKCSNKYQKYGLMLVIWEISGKCLLQTFGY